MEKKNINYEALDQWRKIKGLTWKEMALAGGFTPEYILSIKSKGKVMPSKAILAWKELYSWTAEELDYFCYNGARPTDNKKLLGTTLLEITKKQAEISNDIAAMMKQYTVSGSL